MAHVGQGHLYIKMLNPLIVKKLVTMSETS